ncbi:hypothetical protein, partial [Paracoccus versutus]
MTLTGRRLQAGREGGTRHRMPHHAPVLFANRHAPPTGRGAAMTLTGRRLQAGREGGTRHRMPHHAPVLFANRHAPPTGR